MIDFKNPEELRELMAKVTAGPWECIPLPKKLGAANFSIAWSSDGELVADYVYEEADGAFIALSREALPYWIQQAEQLERAVERLLDALDHGARCPQAGMWDECHDYSDDAKCRACRKAWAMKEDENDVD